MEKVKLATVTLKVEQRNALIGSDISVFWEGIYQPTLQDWIGLYKSDDVDDHCRKRCDTSGTSQGRMSFKLPEDLTLGAYELRLLTNNNSTPITISNPFTVKPRRGGIWLGTLSHARGTEMGAKYDWQWSTSREERHYLIVSADDYNIARDGFTVVPITKYLSQKEILKMPWSVVFQRDRDIDFDQRNATYVRHEQLWTIGFGILDCSQLWTIFPEDIRPDRRCGAFNSDYIEDSIDNALETLLCGEVPSSQVNLTPREGHVLVLDLPGGRRPCLIVSSAAIDAIPYRKNNLGFCTVVPLIDDKQQGDPDPGTARVRIYEPGSKTRSFTAIAMCQEIYTVDWIERKRRGEPVKGEVFDMTGVRTALLDYLGILV